MINKKSTFLFIFLAGIPSTMLIGMEQIEHKRPVPTLKEKAARAVIDQLIEGKTIAYLTQDIVDYLQGVLPDSQYNRIRFLYDSILVAEITNCSISNKEALSVEWCPNRECALAGFIDGTFLFLNLSAKTIDNKFSVENLPMLTDGLRKGIEIIRWRPDGTGALSGSANGSLIYWNVAKDFTITPLTLPAHMGGLRGLFPCIWGLSWSPNGQQALSFAEGDKTLRLWDFSNIHAITFKELAGHTEPVTCAEWGHDGTYIISGSEDKMLRRCDLKDLSNISCEILEGHAEEITALAISPDGQYALSGSCDGEVRLWNLQTKTSSTLQVHDAAAAAVRALYWSPCGRLAITSSEDDAFLLDLSDKNKIPYNHEKDAIELTEMETITSVIWDPNGKFVICASDRLRMYNLKEEPLGIAFELKGHAKHKDIYSVSLSPNGKKALTASADGTIRLWDLDPCADLPLKDILAMSKLLPSIVRGLDLALTVFPAAHKKFLPGFWEAYQRGVRFTLDDKSERIKVVYRFFERTLADCNKLPEPVAQRVIASITRRLEKERKKAEQEAPAESVVEVPDETDDAWEPATKAQKNE